jgi:hypothetical protein
MTGNLYFISQIVEYFQTLLRVVCFRIPNNLFEFSSDIGVRIVFVVIMINEIVIAKGHENHLMQIEFERARDLMIG